MAGARISSTGSIVEVEFDKEMENIEKVLNLFDRQYDIRFNVFQSKNHMNLFIENISEIKKIFNSNDDFSYHYPQQNKGRCFNDYNFSSLGRKGVEKIHTNCYL